MRFFLWNWKLKFTILSLPICEKLSFHYLGLFKVSHSQKRMGKSEFVVTSYISKCCYFSKQGSVCILILCSWTKKFQRERRGTHTHGGKCFLAWHSAFSSVILSPSDAPERLLHTQFPLPGVSFPLGGPHQSPTDTLGPRTLFLEQSISEL